MRIICLRVIKQEVDMNNDTKGFFIELALFGGVLCPIAISMIGGKDSYFWQAFAWLIS